MESQFFQINDTYRVQFVYYSGPPTAIHSVWDPEPPRWLLTEHWRRYQAAMAEFLPQARKAWEQDNGDLVDRH